MSDDKTLERSARSKARLSGGMRALLVGSLTLNLLVAGLVVGAMVFDGPSERRHGGKDHRPAGGREERVDPALGPFGRALEPEHRRAVGEQLRREAGSREDSRRQIATELSMMIELLRAEAFDKDGFQAVLDAQNTRFAERGELGRRLLAEHLEDMSLEERQRVADKLERGFEKAMRRAPEPR